MLKRLLLAVLLVLAPLGAQAASPAEALLRAVGIVEILDIMREEGLVHARDLEAEMFPDSGGAAWEQAAGRIYDSAAMYRRLAEDFEGRLDAAEIAEVSDFFTSPLGRRIVELETAARRALLDPAVEEAGERALEEMIARRDPRLELLMEFVEVNDLIESNVAGALNSNYAFYLGLIDGGAFDGTMSERDILNDVWSQEPEIRAETRDWLFSYLAMAYGPLSDAELEQYIALARERAGIAYNRALFEAFDVMFADISRQLGLNAARFLMAERI
jgi:hypothetical protein